MTGRAHVLVRKVRTPLPDDAPGLTAHRWTRLLVHVGRAFEQMPAMGAAALRGLVPRLAGEMRLAGASWAQIETVVRQGVTLHPDFGRYDRMNIVTAERETETLDAWRLRYVQRARASEGDTATGAQADDATSLQHSVTNSR